MHIHTFFLFNFPFNMCMMIATHDISIYLWALIKCYAPPTPGLAANVGTAHLRVFVA